MTINSRDGLWPNGQKKERTKRLDSDKHYGGRKICSSPRRQRCRSRATSLYIRRLFSSSCLLDPFLFIRSRWGMLPTGGWAPGHMETREEKKRRQERNTEEPWSGPTYCIFSSKTSALRWYLCSFWGYRSTKTHTVCPASSLHTHATIEWAWSKMICAYIFCINNSYVENSPEFRKGPSCVREVWTSSRIWEQCSQFFCLWIVFFIEVYSCIHRPFTMDTFI